MAGRQIKDLMRAFRSRDEVSFRRAALEIIEEEEARQHFALARDMRALLAMNAGAGRDVVVALPTAPRSRDGDSELADVRVSDVAWEDLVLNVHIGQALEEFAYEVAHWDALDAAAIPRRQKLLMAGPPGTGKTSAAQALATALGWPLATVSIDTVVSSYLGETASNLRRLFEFASEQRMVVLFDEFDALGRSRDDSSEHGEMKRVVSSFLQFLERYQGPSVIVAVTNHPGLLDGALWRRFDEVLEFPLPSVHEIRRILRLRSRSMEHKPFSVDETASRLKGLPQAAVEKFVLDLRRSQALHGAAATSADVVERSIEELRRRPW